MPGSPNIEVHRAGPRQKVVSAIPVLGWAIGGLLIAAGDSATAVAVVAVVDVAVAALVYLTIWWPRTLVRADRVIATGLFGRRELAWPDVQAIETEFNPSVIMKDASPMGELIPGAVVAVYDGRGRRTVLPWVPGAPTIVERLRELWHRSRGPHWAPTEQAAAGQDRARRSSDRLTAYIVGMVAGLCTFMLLAVVTVILIVTNGPVVPLPWSAVVSVAVGGTVFGVGLWKAARRPS